MTVTAPDEPRLELDRVSYTYTTGVEAVRDVSLQLMPGSRLGIVGPSGCGKTTLLNLLAGLRQPTAGEVRRARLEPGVHPLAMVFQKDTLLPWLNVAQNVRLHDRLSNGVLGWGRSRRAGRDGRTDELLEMARLTGRERAYPYQLSGGMRRRVAFLAAVAASPATLLLDEPFSSLDEPTRVALHQDVLTILDRLQMSTVLVTHDLAEAISLCHQVVILTSGPGSVYARHDIPFGSDRDVLRLRQTPEFLDLYATLWRDLSLQIKASDRSRTPPAGPAAVPAATGVRS